jgi:hypothetical protein
MNFRKFWLPISLLFAVMMLSCIAGATASCGHDDHSADYSSSKQVKERTVYVSAEKHTVTVGKKQITYTIQGERIYKGKDLYKDRIALSFNNHKEMDLCIGCHSRNWNDISPVIVDYGLRNNMKCTMAVHDQTRFCEILDAYPGKNGPNPIIFSGYASYFR